MIKKFGFVLVVLSLAIAPTVLAEDVFDQSTFKDLSAYAETSSGDYIRAYGSEYENLYSYASISLFGYFLGEEFSCFQYDVFGLVKVAGSAKLGTIDVHTSELICTGTPPQMISVKCMANGEISNQYISNGTSRYGDGTSSKDHGVGKSELADCTITADSQIYDQYNNEGFLMYSSMHYKYKE